MTKKNYRRTLSSVGLVSILLPGGGNAAVANDDAASAPQSASEPLVDVFRADHVYLLAGHRSHSSHRSHGSHQSHRSSSGGGSSGSAPVYVAPSRNTNSTPETSVLPSSPYVALRQQPLEFEEHVELTRRVQAKLWAGGRYSGALDGVAGPETKAAISKFEAARGMEITGRITPGLLVALEVDSAAVFDEAVYLKTLPGNSAKFKRIVQDAQVVLFVFGYYSGLIDGVVGPDTRDAISKFQIDNGIAANGALTPETLDALHIIAN